MREENKGFISSGKRHRFILAVDPGGEVHAVGLVDVHHIPAVDIEGHCLVHGDGSLI